MQFAISQMTISCKFHAGNRHECLFVADSMTKIDINGYLECSEIDINGYFAAELPM